MDRQSPKEFVFMKAESRFYVLRTWEYLYLIWKMPPLSRCIFSSLVSRKANIYISFESFLNVNESESSAKVYKKRWLTMGWVLSLNFSRSPWSKNSSATRFAKRCCCSQGLAMALTSQAVISIPHSTENFERFIFAFHQAEWSKIVDMTWKAYNGSESHNLIFMEYEEWAYVLSFLALASQFRQCWPSPKIDLSYESRVPSRWREWLVPLLSLLYDNPLC